MKVHIKGLSVLKSYLANKIKEGYCMNSSVEGHPLSYLGKI